MAFQAIPQVPQAPQVGVSPTTPQDRANRLAKRNALARLGAYGGSYVSSLPTGTVVQGQVLPHGEAVNVSGRTITYKPFIFDDGSNDVFIGVPSKSSKGSTNCVLAVGYTDPVTNIDAVAFILPPDMTPQQIAGLLPNAVVSIVVGEYGEGRETGLWKLA